jgi:N-acetylglucosamine-6-phosphate deacetylase
VSLGHTDASLETFERAAEAGATLVTHLYSAMSPFHHREPGAVGAALALDRLTACLIPDGIHTHPASLRIALSAKGASRLALVSDAMAAAGCGPGAYTLGGQTVHVRDGAARLADGTLAGSAILLDEAVRGMVALGGATPGEALAMASTVPARALGLARTGRIAEGLDADLVLLDGDLHVRGTLVRGKPQHDLW